MVPMASFPKAEELLAHRTVVAKLLRVVTDVIPAREVQRAELPEYLFTVHGLEVFLFCHVRGEGEIHLTFDDCHGRIAQTNFVTGAYHSLVPMAVALVKLPLLTSAELPIAMLLLPVKLVASARTPLVVLLLPVVLFSSARTPLAVLPPPLVLLRSASLPLAVLSLPVVLLTSAALPLAVLSLTVVLVKSANCPLAVLPAPVVLF